MISLEEAIAMVGASDMGAPVFKRASSGATQIWRVEREENKFRTIHGQIDGAQITSEWTVCAGKNIGKKNETSPVEQAKLEVIALYKKKTAQGKYSYALEDIDEHTYLSPMLAQPFDEKRLVLGSSVQPKLDGVRCIVDRHGMWSRKGKTFPACMHIHENLKEVFKEYPDLILDGELYNHDLKADFEELISLIRQSKPTQDDLDRAKEKVHFHVYDCPSILGDWKLRIDNVGNLLNNSYVEDEHNGQFSYSTEYKNVYLVDYWSEQNTPEMIEARFKTCVDAGYEGVMVKLPDLEYETKRTYQIMKYKNFIDEEFEVLDIEEGKGNWAGHAKIATLRHPNGNVFGAGVKGTKAYAKKLLENKHEVIGKKATVTYFRLTNAGVPYLPILKVIRDYE